MMRYNPNEIEPKWQMDWQSRNVYAAVDNDTRTPYYFLMEFPYPSGDGLHVGHVLGFTALDIMARLKRMKGFNVLYPVGFDAFGLPTENYAIKHKVAPQVATEKNIANFRRQFKSLGLSFDWSREINTTDPSYYRWTQWIFLRLFDAGLAYQAAMPINWCPFEKTGLANEEVVDGRHERCGTLVEKKTLNQWMLRITKYADRLIDDLKDVDYLDRISSQQINWIGKSEGVEIDFEVAGEKLTVYSTRPDTLAGATFLVIAPEHPLAKTITTPERLNAVTEYIKAVQSESEIARQETTRKKTGVDTGAQAINPITLEPMHVWVADYVLSGYGTGAIMAVPAHDQRDFDFAKVFGLPVRQVIEPVLDIAEMLTQPGAETSSICVIIEHPNQAQYLSIPNSPFEYLHIGSSDANEDITSAAARIVSSITGYNGTLTLEAYNWEVACADQKGQLPITIVRAKIADHDTKLTVNSTYSWNSVAKLRAANKTKVGENIIHWLTTGVSAIVADGALIHSSQFDGLSSSNAKHQITSWLESSKVGRVSHQYKLRDWIFSRQHYWGEPIPIIHCPDHGAVPVPLTELPVELPVVESYEPTDTGESPLSSIAEWVNTTCPTCGGPAKRETDTMPNWAGSSWYYLRYIDPTNSDAFASKSALDYWTPVDLYNGGMEHTTLHLLYSRFWHKFLYDEGLVPTKEPYAKRRSHGMILGPDGVKMSKSRGNVINPDHVVEKYGADTIRLYEMFMGPFDAEKTWSEEHLSGVSRFIWKVWGLAQELIDEPNQDEDSQVSSIDAFTTDIHRATNKTLLKVGDDIESMSFNTAVSTLMEYVNYLNRLETKQRLLRHDAGAIRRTTLEKLLLMLSPFTPHLTEELWHVIGNKTSIHVAAWPDIEQKYLVNDEMTIVVQVNGKVRTTLIVPTGTSSEELEQMAKADDKVSRHIEGKTIIKSVVIPNRVVNFVVKP